MDLKSERLNLKLKEVNNFDNNLDNVIQTNSSKKKDNSILKKKVDKKNEEKIENNNKTYSYNSKVNTEFININNKNTINNKKDDNIDISLISNKDYNTIVIDVGKNNNGKNESKKNDNKIINNENKNDTKNKNTINNNENISNNVYIYNNKENKINNNDNNDNNDNKNNEKQDDDDDVKILNINMNIIKKESEKNTLNNNNIINDNEENSEKKNSSKISSSDIDDMYFNDENNYFLPKIETMNEYPKDLVKYKNNEFKILDNIDDSIDKYKIKEKNTLFLEKKYVEEKIYDINKYIKKYDDSQMSIFNEFIDNFGEEPFFGFNKDLENNSNDKSKSEINNKNENIKQRSYTSIGNIEHFVNLIYKYKKYIINKEENKENEKDINNTDTLYKQLKLFESKSEIKDKYIINLKQKEISYYRNILNDGNSFFRAFMFALIESYILEKNVKYFKILMAMISNSFYNRIYKDKKIDYLRPKTRLEEILKHLQNDKVVDALQLFYSSFSFNYQLLEEFLINFIKITLSFSKKEVLSEIYLELVEFEIFDLVLLPFIFDITLEVSFDINIGKNNFLIFDTNRKNKHKSLMQLCFYKNNTFIYYNKDKYLKLVEYNIIQKYDNKPKINKIIYKFEKKEKCKQCGNETHHIALIEKSISVCESCLNNCIQKSILYRVNYLKNNICRDIIFKNFVINNEKFLNDYEYIHIYNNFIIGSIQKQLLHNNNNKNNNWFCSKCLNFECNIKKLDCGCYYCKKCLDAIIEKMTDKYIILNQYEKKHVGKIRCICGNNMDIIKIIEENEKSIKKNNKKYKLMNNRLNHYIKSICMNCDKNIYSNDKRKEIRVIDNKIEGIEENHVLCKTCFKGINLEGNNQVRILCQICNAHHIIIGK